MEVKTAEDGEILVRGPLNTPGYLGRRRRRPALLGADGWLHTGDIGALDADQFLRVVDRKKEAHHHGRGREHLTGGSRGPA